MPASHKPPAADSAAQPSAAPEPEAAPVSDRGPSLSGRVATRLILLVLVLAAAAARLVWFHAPPGRDEAGYLLIAGQWHPGTSIYGNYWVDRPPLLMAFFALGHVLGGLGALRVLGCVVVALTVLAAYSLGRVLGREGGSPLWPAATAAAFISTPVFGATFINGELLAVPFVLVGMLSVVHGIAASSQRRRGWWLLAGAMAAGACLVKQNFLDVFVFAAAVATSALILRSPRSDRVHARDLGWLVLGAAGVSAAVLLVSDLLGTTPRELWDALVVFRVQAAGTLARSAGPATDTRLASYPGALLVAGAIPLAVAFLVRLVTRRPSVVAVATAVTIAWEIVSVLAGQQAWSHYLLGLTPGLVLASSLATSRPARMAWAARLCVCYAVAATLVAVVTTPVPVATKNQIVGQWLGAAARPGDEAVVLLGQPAILEVAGLQSPYEQMFMLPMMVEDPNYASLMRVLTGPRAPEWVVLDTHHRNAGHQTGPVLRRRYVQETEVCGYRMYVRVGTTRPIPPIPKHCGGNGS